MRIAPVFELVMRVDHHASAHPWHRKQLHIIARVPADHHAILRRVAGLLDLHPDLKLTLLSSTDANGQQVFVIGQPTTAM